MAKDKLPLLLARRIDGVFAAVIFAIVGMWSAVCNSAFAQATPSSVIPVTIGGPGIRQAKPVERTRSAQEAESYLAMGLPLDSFILFPAFEFDQSYNDNIYSTAYGTAGKTASLIEEFRPSIELRSTWVNHMVHLFASGDIAFYNASSLANYQDFTLGGEARLDVQRDEQIHAAGGFYRLHDAPGSPSIPVGQTVPVPYNQGVAILSYVRSFNKFSVRLDGRMDRYDWLFNVLGPAQGQVYNTDRDRFEFREALRVSYEFSPGYQVWARGGLNQRRYDGTVDALGYDRSSTGWDAVLGVTMDFGGITALEVFGGWVQQNYEDWRLTNLSTPTFGMALYWNPLRQLTVKSFVQRTVEEAYTITANGFLNTLMGVDINYELRPNISLNAFGSLALIDYFPVLGYPLEKDVYLTLALGLTYYLTPRAFIGPRYQYSSRSSNIPSSDYSQNLITLRLGTRL